MSKNQTISVAMATLNEESNIDRNLKAINNWVDEIVIADGGSTDNTISLAKKYSKVKILNVKHEDMFHINKQKAIDECKSDWILQLDTDEIVSLDLQKEILKTINENPIENGFWINRSNYFLGSFLKKGGIYPDPTIRLYRNGSGRLPCKDIHEQAVVTGQVGQLKSDLLHYSDPNFSRYLIRHDRYTSLLATDYKNQKVKINTINTIKYYFCKPIYWFVLSYFRHRGYVDGFPGFVFAFYSSLRFASAYTKLYELHKNEKI